jgi:hypothetical protein
MNSWQQTIRHMLVDHGGSLFSKAADEHFAQFGKPAAEVDPREAA